MRALMAALYEKPEISTEKTEYIPPFIESAFDSFSANVQLGKTVTRQDTKSVTIEESEDVVILVQTSFWTNFYGSRNPAQKIYVYLKIDGNTVSTKEITYIEGGEYTLQMFNGAYRLDKGEHKFTLYVQAKSIDANLDLALTSSDITLTHTGKVYESEEVQ